MKVLLLIITCSLALIPASPPKNMGIFRFAADIGKPAVKGSSSFDEKTNTYHLKGGGYNIWFDRDEFHYCYDSLQGDFKLTARLTLLGNGKNAHRKIGWMARESGRDNAAHISATLHGDGLTVLQWRRMQGDSMRDPEDEIFYPHKNVERLQLERKGNLFIMRAAGPGEALQLVGQHEMPGWKKTILAGLFICSHDANTMEEGTASGVEVSRP